MPSFLPDLLNESTATGWQTGGWQVLDRKSITMPCLAEQAFLIHL